MFHPQTYDGNVQDLGLDFTVVTEELGQTIVEDLKQNGSDIPVTNENRYHLILKLRYFYYILIFLELSCRIEYVHLVADYKLNRQIRIQCNAFRQVLFFKKAYFEFSLQKA